MPIYFKLFTVIAAAIISCTESKQKLNELPGGDVEFPKTIRGISLPHGFNYADAYYPSYADWLLNLQLKSDSIVYLYNGQPKTNQHAQYAILNIDIGKKDLLQCADAAMKLRADYLFQNHKYSQMKFVTGTGQELIFSDWLKGKRWKEQGSKLVSFRINNQPGNLKNDYNSFMQLVYSYCGTYSLSKQLKAVKNINSIQAGDVFVQGGFPGHAVTVMAVAKNETGKKIFLLSEGFMPAQDIHILKNIGDPELSPWYDLSAIYPLGTPEWVFKSDCLKSW